MVSWLLGVHVEGFGGSVGWGGIVSTLAKGEDSSVLSPLACGTCRGDAGPNQVRVLLGGKNPSQEHA